MSDSTSNGKIYELIDRTRLESKSDVLRLEAKLDILSESVTKLREKEATLATKVYVLVFIISSTISALVTAVASRVLVK